MKAKIKYADPKNPMNDFIQFTEIEFDTPFDETYWRNKWAGDALLFIYENPDITQDQIAKESFDMADAMISESKKRREKCTPK